MVITLLATSLNDTKAPDVWQYEEECIPKEKENVQLKKEINKPV